METKDEPSHLEFDEVLQIQEQFATDLEEVFEGKELEFSDHLRGLLLELWSRARGSSSSIVKELEELRQLKAERLELQEMIANTIKAQLPELLKTELPSVSDQFKSTFESVLEMQLKPQLINQLQNFDLDFDKAMSTCLARVIVPTNGLTTTHSVGFLEIGPEAGELVAGLPKFEGVKDDGTVDKTQENLQARLRFEGLIAPESSPDAWKWRPVQIHIETGELVGFQPGYPADTYPAVEPIRVRLSWDGSYWRFPNPRPAGMSGSCLQAVRIFIDGIEQDQSQHGLWNWTTELDVVGKEVLATVMINTTIGHEVVEAEYRVMP